MKKTFLKDFGALLRPYWTSEERWIALGLVMGMVAMDLGMNYLSVLINRWNNVFYTALQDKQSAVVIHQLFRFALLAGIYVVVAVYQFYVSQSLQIRWRRWLTLRYVGRWLGGHAHYHLQLIDGKTDNPDQRIAEDINSFVSNTVQLTMGLFDAIVSLACFFTILWGLSGAFHWRGLVIPGYMVWIALLYSMAGSWITHWLGRPLVDLNFQQQHLEADFRFSLMRLRENAEGVALYHGEEQEGRVLTGRFAKVIANAWRVVYRTRRLMWFSSGYNQLMTVVPYILAAPRYFSGAIQLGGLMQTGSAFLQVQTSLSWLVGAYGGIAGWKATTDRLIGFENALTQAKAAPSAASRREVPGSAGIGVSDLHAWLPNGTPLFENVTLRFAPRSRTLISGPSGCGKSTLFNVLSGIWPYYRGTVDLPPDQRLLFLPQKPYLPTATLRQTLAYPDSLESHSHENILEALHACGLDHLQGRFDKEDNWTHQLSPGEQQRLAFARVLLIRPAWLFLDEATSALDEPSEAHLYGLLAHRLPDTAIVSIAHKPTLAAFHSHRLVFEKNGGHGRFSKAG